MERAHVKGKTRNFIGSRTHERMKEACALTSPSLRIPNQGDCRILKYFSTRPTFPFSPDDSQLFARICVCVRARACLCLFARAFSRRDLSLPAAEQFAREGLDLAMVDCTYVQGDGLSPLRFDGSGE